MGVLVDMTRGIVIAHAVVRADTSWKRTAGLLGVRALAPEQGLWLEPCSSVHTVGMLVPIDIVLLDSEHRVLAIAPDVRPMRPFVSHRKTSIVVELPHGFSARAGIGVGNELRFFDILPRVPVPKRAPAWLNRIGAAR